MKNRGIGFLSLIIVLGLLIIARATFPVLAQEKQSLDTSNLLSSSDLEAPSELNDSYAPIPHPIFSDVRIRQAIAYCTDKDALVASVYPSLTFTERQELIMDAVISKHNWAYTAPATTYPYNPTLGQNLLDAAGWTLSLGADYRTKAGKELVLTISASDANFRKTFLAVFETQMKACGIHLIRNHTTGSWIFGENTGIQVRDFELVEYAWVLHNNEPGGKTIYACDQIPSFNNDWTGQNYVGWCNQTASDAIIQADNTGLSQDQRKAYYATVIDKIAEDVPSLPLFLRMGSTPEEYTWEHIDFNLHTYSQKSDVATGLSADLTYTDYEGNQQTVSVPSGAVTQTVSLVFYPLVDNANPIPGTMDAANAFRLNASISGLPQDTFSFEKPITVTVKYTTTETVNNLDEDSLALYYWDDSISSWIDASETCPVGERYKWLDTVHNYYEARICHLSEFGLLGIKKNLGFLPVLIR